MNTLILNRESFKLPSDNWYQLAPLGDFPHDGAEVLLDTASYRSWAAAAADGDRGPWVLGDGMTLSDAPMGLTTNVAVSGITLRFIDGVFDGIEP